VTLLWLLCPSLLQPYTRILAFQLMPLNLKKLTQHNNTQYWSLYYKTLQIHNLRENVRFCNKLVTLAGANTLLLEQTLAYYGVRRLQTLIFFGEVVVRRQTLRRLLLRSRST
jgi:hypothetical protein